MSGFVLRDYQHESIAAVAADRLRGFTRLVINLPTGMGKTVIMCFMARDAPGKVMLMMHRRELINQTIKQLRKICPNRTIGRIQAGVKETNADIIVASVQTLATNKGLAASLGGVALMVIDECHHAAARTYRDAVRDVAPDLLVGFTATLARNDEKGLGDLWQKVSLKKTVAWGEKHGYILPSIDEPITVPALDLSQASVHINEWGEEDYSDKDVETALLNADAGRILAREFKARAGRRLGVVFVPTKKAAHAIAADFTRAGIATGVITGDTKSVDRDEMFEDMRAGRLQVLVNCMVLTEGFDMPEIEVVVIARITRSQSLYIQMRGRGTRPCPEIGKKNLLLLDTVGVTTEHDVDVKPQLKRTGTPLTPVPRPKMITKAAAAARQKSPATSRPAPGRATYDIRTTGRMVIVMRDGTQIAKAFAKTAVQAPELGRLLVKKDQAERLRS